MLLRSLACTWGVDCRWIDRLIDWLIYSGYRGFWACIPSYSLTWLVRRPLSISHYCLRWKGHLHVLNNRDWVVFKKGSWLWPAWGVELMRYFADCNRRAEHDICISSGYVCAAAKRKKSVQVYPCTECGETFRYRNVLLRHMAQKHNKSSGTGTGGQTGKTEPATDETAEAGTNATADQTSHDTSTEDTTKGELNSCFSCCFFCASLVVSFKILYAVCFWQIIEHIVPSQYLIHSAYIQNTKFQ